MDIDWDIILDISANYNNFTIVVQGPIHQRSIDCFGGFKNIIFSCWRDCDPTKVPSHATVIQTSWNHQNHYNRNNVLRQIISSLNGVLITETDYVIKVRSDEEYENLKPVFDAVLENPDKLVTNNTFFRPDEHYKFHPSDHIMAGSRETLKKLFRKAKELCARITSSPTIATGEHIGVPGMGIVPPEVLLCVAYLISKNVNICLDQSRQIMLEHVSLVNNYDLGRFVTVSNSVGTIYTEADNSLDGIRRMEDL